MEDRQWILDNGCIWSETKEEQKDNIVIIVCHWQNKELEMYYNFIIKKLATNKQFKQTEDPL